MLKHNFLPDWAMRQFRIEWPGEHDLATMAIIREHFHELTFEDWTKILCSQNTNAIESTLAFGDPPREDRYLPFIYRAAIISPAAYALLMRINEGRKDYNLVLRQSLDLADPYVWLYYYTYRGDRVLNDKEGTSYVVELDRFGRDQMEPNRLGWRIADQFSEELIYKEGRALLASLATEIESDMTLYRGQIEEPQLGIAKTRNFLSCSLEHAGTHEFAKGGYILTLRVKAGTKLIAVDDRPDVICRNYYHTSNEHEYIMPPDTSFEVVHFSSN